MMVQRRVVIILALVVLAFAGVIVWWLASPLFLNQTVNEQFAVPTSVATDMPVMNETMPAEMTYAVKVKSGNFRDNGDGFHKGSGQATIYRQADGSYVLRLENFKATNGPDLHVYLSPTNDPMNNDQVLVTGYIDLAVLKGNIGNQNYLMPANVDVTKLNSVIIWCKAFSVIFSVAPLS